MNKVVVETKPRIYWNVIVFDPILKKKNYFQYADKNFKILIDLKKEGFEIIKNFISKGSEIKREINLCSKCFQNGGN